MSSRDANMTNVEIHDNCDMRNMQKRVFCMMFAAVLVNQGYYLCMEEA